MKEQPFLSRRIAQRIKCHISILVVGEDRHRILIQSYLRVNTYKVLAAIPAKNLSRK